MRLDRINNRAAAKFLDDHHPLGFGAKNVTVSLGIFWAGKLEGVMTFGAPVSNQAVSRYGLRLCDALELRKMWMSDVPPAMSESRALGVAARLVKKHYPRLKLLITYCDETDRAASYKAAGWIPQDAQRYVREVLVNGKRLSMRDANRKAVTKQATEKRYEHRRKWVLPLAPDMIEVIQRAGSDTSDTPAIQAGEGGSRPTPALQ